MTQLSNYFRVSAVSHVVNDVHEFLALLSAVEVLVVLDEGQFSGFEEQRRGCNDCRGVDAFDEVVELVLFEVKQGRL